MSSWDGRCKRCRRLMSICKCFVAPAAGDQNNNPNGLSDDDDTMTSPMQLAHGKRHLFETLKERHPMRSNVLLKSIHGAGERDSERHIHEPQYTPQQQRKMSASSARSRTDTRASQSQHHRVGAGIAARRPPSSSSVPAISSHISRPSTSSSSSSVHRHSSPVPPRPPTAIPMPTSNSDPAGIKYYQTHQQSSSRPPSSSSSHSNRRSQRVDSAQYYVPGSGGYPVMTPDETDPSTYEL